MQQSNSISYEYSGRDQAQYIALMSVSAVVLLIARILQPSANGYGTHQQLGLPPCFFHQMTGIPCPTCGMTTSFAHAVRFHFYESFITQPFGLIACLCTALLIPLSLLMMRRRVPWMKFLTSRQSNWLMYAMVALLLAGWIYKIWVMR